MTYIEQTQNFITVGNTKLYQVISTQSLNIRGHIIKKDTLGGYIPKMSKEELCNRLLNSWIGADSVIMCNSINLSNTIIDNTSITLGETHTLSMKNSSLTSSSITGIKDADLYITDTEIHKSSIILNHDLSVVIDNSKICHSLINTHLSIWYSTIDSSVCENTELRNCEVVHSRLIACIMKDSRLYKCIYTNCNLYKSEMKNSTKKQCAYANIKKEGSEYSILDKTNSELIIEIPEMFSVKVRNNLFLVKAQVDIDDVPEAYIKLIREVYKTYATVFIG